MGYLGATLTPVFTRRGLNGRVTQRCHNSPDGKRGLQSAGDVTHRKRTEDFGNFEKVSELSSWLGRRQLTFGAHRGQTNLRATGVARDGGQMKKPA